MNRKNRIRLAGLTMACMILLGSFAGQRVHALTMSSVTSNSIKEKEAQIQSALSEKKSLQGGLSNVQKMKKELEAKKNDLKAYVAQLDANLAEIEAHILELIDKITVKEGEIEVAQVELDMAHGNEAVQKETMVNHVRLVYENGDKQMVELLREATGFGDFLNKADYVEKVMTYDQKILQDYVNVREYVQLCEQELEIEKEILDETKAGVEEEQHNLEELIEQKKIDIENYEKDINNQEKAIREYQQEIKAQEEEISTLERLIAEEKKKILASSGVVLTYDGGAFKFPVASYTRVSDDYGNRIHPTLKVQQFHNGVDLASPYGTAIYAAYDGVVVAATYSATMGNYVMIDHGSGLYTIYMHASSLLVAKDDIVIRGETIAKVGSTGRSTGNHLHFSVRKDGSYVSPWNYISK